MDGLLIISIILVVAILSYFAPYLYMLPWIIAKKRQSDNTLFIFWFNLILGFTLIGWLVAMGLALWKTEKVESTNVWHKNFHYYCLANAIIFATITLVYFQIVNNTSTSENTSNQEVTVANGIVEMIDSALSTTAPQEETAVQQKEKVTPVKLERVYSKFIPNTNFEIIIERETTNTSDVAWNDGTPYLKVKTKNGESETIVKGSETDIMDVESDDIDLDNDGITEVVFYTGTSGNACTPSYAVVSFKNNEVHLSNDIGGCSQLTFNKTTKLFTEIDTVDETTTVYQFKNGKLVPVKVIPVKALPTLLSFSIDDPNFDFNDFERKVNINNNTIPDKLSCMVGRNFLDCEIHFDNKVVENSELNKLAGRRIGILSTVTNGYHDIVVNKADVYQWNGKDRYIGKNKK